MFCIMKVKKIKNRNERGDTKMAAKKKAKKTAKKKTAKKGKKR